jgi:ABC-type amino acid transport system permease subunit
MLPSGSGLTLPEWPSRVSRVIWPVVALFYLAVTFPLSRLAGVLERRWEVRR